MGGLFAPPCARTLAPWYACLQQRDTALTVCAHAWGCCGCWGVGKTWLHSRSIQCASTCQEVHIIRAHRPTVFCVLSRCRSGLDYLSSPSGVIKAAQDLATVAFKAQQTWFLVNGCSVGIHAAVMATVKPGEALLLARNCHLSAFSACVLSNAVPVWLQPEQDAVHGIAHCVTPEQLQVGFEAAQARGLKVGAVLVVSPTYYGAVARVSGA